MNFEGRRSGVLLHPSSLPGISGIGTLGAEAYRFVDWLHLAGQKVWQILPLGPTDYSHSPYQSYSAFAGNPDLIDPGLLVKEGYLPAGALENPPVFPGEKVQFSALLPYRENLLRKAFAKFSSGHGFEKPGWWQFWDENSWWLDSWSLFDACTRHSKTTDWNGWDQELRGRQEIAMQEARLDFEEDVWFSRFLQYIFFSQWYSLKKYANEKGISIFGDLPLYVSYNSSDVWSNQHLFLLNPQRKPEMVGGVPPDYFSETGQLWGNPLYDWGRIKDDNFGWWMARLHFNLRMYDMVRIDHFRGLESFWAVPAEEKNAINGQWMKAEGDDMLNLLQQQIGSLPIVAEDLGLITEEVHQLRTKYRLPGMKVLQFAFSDEDNNPHLPHNHSQDFLVYTGTHDNNTTRGWLSSMPASEKERLKAYLGKESPSSATLIRKAMESVAHLAIIPMQDILNLGTSARMNTPGTIKGNWIWRMGPDMLTEESAEQMASLAKTYGRS